ncbi:hypothetical protein ALC62_05024 [Cyphomyrmex costatus]|uniref:Uncharacterized protein n=1 Tax=Cyphomyrmex costatus TaxID=456900 RepID=A0A195CU97_9HYME|nr:hypothetical protein ALC62_05024 [Cyphomyrmex costatus]
MYDLIGSVPRRARLLKNVRHEDASGYESSRNGATGIRSNTKGGIPRRDKQKKVGLLRKRSPFGRHSGASKSGNFSGQVRIKLSRSGMVLGEGGQTRPHFPLHPLLAYCYAGRGYSRFYRDHQATYAIVGPPEGRCRQMAGRCLQSCPDCRSGRRVSRP